MYMPLAPEPAMVLIKARLKLDEDPVDAVLHMARDAIGGVNDPNALKMILPAASVVEAIEAAGTVNPVI